MLAPHTVEQPLFIGSERPLRADVGEALLVAASFTQLQVRQTAEHAQHRASQPPAATEPTQHAQGDGEHHHDADRIAPPHA